MTTSLPTSSELTPVNATRPALPLGPLAEHAALFNQLLAMAPVVGPALGLDLSGMPANGTLSDMIYAMYDKDSVKFRSDLLGYIAWLGTIEKTLYPHLETFDVIDRVKRTRRARTPKEHVSSVEPTYLPDVEEETEKAAIIAAMWAEGSDDETSATQHPNGATGLDSGSNQIGQVNPSGTSDSAYAPDATGK